MTQEFERLLDECLFQLNSGEADLETILAQHPEEAEALRPLLSAALRIQSAPHPAPSPIAKSIGKQKLMMEVARRRQEREHRRSVVVRDQAMGWLGRILPPSSPVRRLAFSVATIALLFVMSGLGMTRVAAYSLPDSPLYPIKLATEHVQLVLAPSPGERARLHIEFAERRVAETRVLAENGGDVDRLVLAMIRQNKQAFGAIAQMPAQDRAPLLADLAAVTRIERRALTELKYRLSPEGQRLVSDAIAYSAEDQARAEEARANPNLVRLIPTALPPIMTGTADSTPVPPTATAVKVLIPARSDTDKPDRRPTEVPTEVPKPPRPAVPQPTSPPPPPPAPTQVLASQPDVSEPDRDDDDEAGPAPTPVAPQPTGEVTGEPTAGPVNPTIPPDFAEPIGTPEPLP